METERYDLLADCNAFDKTPFFAVKAFAPLEFASPVATLNFALIIDHRVVDELFVKVFHIVTRFRVYR
jgi:hypothetical protein